VVTEEAAKHPDKPGEVWATDEHRMGLKPESYPHFIWLR